MKFRMNQTVKILPSKKVDGRYNYGSIFGIEKVQNNYYLGYRDEKEFKSRFTRERYKVVYIDCTTDRACEEWFYDDELEIKSF